jgi:hypothetical protein
VKRGLIAAALVLFMAGTAAAQFGGGFGGFFGGGRRAPLRLPKPDTFGQGFNFCRGIYTSDRREAGGQGWSTDYPDGEANFSIRLSELTKVRVKFNAPHDADYVTVPLDDPDLFQCPYLHLEDVGTAAFTKEELDGLRAFLLKGGFVWTDDAWGTEAWEHWVEEMKRVLPEAEYQFHDVPLDHPIFSAQFEIKQLPQIPAIQHWRQFGGPGSSTSERGEDSAVPLIRAITDRHGNVMVLSTHNTDITDAWEREGEDPRYFYSFSPDGYALGINVILYAMTH